MKTEQVESVMPQEHTVKNSSRILRKRVFLFCYDTALFFLAAWAIWFAGGRPMAPLTAFFHMLFALCVLATARILCGIYRFLWRYSTVYAYAHIIWADLCAFAVYAAVNVLFIREKVPFVGVVAAAGANTIATMVLRIAYCYIYRWGKKKSPFAAFCRNVHHLMTGSRIRCSVADGMDGAQKIRIAIVGAGQTGVSLAQELNSNSHASHRPCCFVDIDPEKIGCRVEGVPVLAENGHTLERLAACGVQEIVIALPEQGPEEKRRAYELYKATGLPVKVYDYPTMQSVGAGRRHMREFDIEELLFRKTVNFTDEATTAYYRDKVVLITGGGGSIGSELCRQIAKMSPQKLIILDVYENGAYNIQQELRMTFGKDFPVCVEILSVCDRKALAHVFEKYRPHIVLNAAAHKHVPLMEHNCCEAVWNNVFGTLNAVELSEEYGAERFIMISTDKAVNPTNVMGATKRMCEMIVQSHAGNGSGTVFSATRFGNVLGSAGSVIPLFKRQIAAGGPVTLTDKRIIRYFMTIPEASQLVLQSGAMAKNGELFVLDMGKPVRILDLAENMIRLSGLVPYQDIAIEEIGLRPGEKLYEELLIRTEELDRTANSMIFIERDTPVSKDALAEKLNVLRRALAIGDEDGMRAALGMVVPTYHSPEEVNAAAAGAEEMKQAFQPV